MDPIIKKQRIASLILKEKIDELSKSEKEENIRPLTRKKFQRGYCQIPANKYYPRLG